MKTNIIPLKIKQLMEIKNKKMTAKEFIEDRFDTDWTIQISANDLEHVLVDFAETYHKHKVEDITDEEIAKKEPENQYFRLGAYWFKNKLLKQ